MDEATRGRAMELLGGFNDELTRVFGDVFEIPWAEIEEILVIAAIGSRREVTTRELGILTQMNRRAMSRMLARLLSDGIVQTHPASGDRRAVAVALTPSGEARVASLRAAMEAFFVESADTARVIVAGLGGGSRTPSASGDVMELLCRVCEAGVGLVRAMPEAASEGRLAARQRAALVLVAGSSRVRPHELATALGVSRAGAAYIVDQLCAKNFIARRRGALPEDRRAVVLEVTAEGAQAVGAVMTAIGAHSERLSDVFTEIMLWATVHSGRAERRVGAESAPLSRG